MRKWVPAIAIIMAVYLDSILLNIICVFDFRPDMLLAVIVSMGVLIGGMPSAAIGIGVGLVVDVLFNKYIGLSALCLMAGGLVGGAFFGKFYADNVIVPSVTAAVLAFLKEHIFLIVSLLRGANIAGYMITLAAYIIPSALLTGGVCALVHFILKKTMFKPLWRKSIDA